VGNELIGIQEQDITVNAFTVLSCFTNKGSFTEKSVYLSLLVIAHYFGGSVDAYRSIA
jgi:hypothetical protein